MENGEINYVFIPSLKHIALVKITVALWNRSDVRDLVERGWQNMINKVEGIVPQLPLPEKLKEEISGLVKPIGFEIKRWKKNFENHTTHDLGRNLPVKLCWTPRGTVQEKKTAELFVKDETLHITKRFRIACVYCLEEEIKELWNAMPQRNKDILDEDKENFFFVCPLMVFWIYNVKGELTKFSDLIARLCKSGSTPYQYAFKCSVSGNLKESAQYFLRKLTPRESESMANYALGLAKRHFDIITSSDNYPEADSYADILFFLLSQMDEGEQERMLIVDPAGVLSCLLCWPWQSFFMETANRIWEDLPEEHYQLLIRIITTKMKNGYKDYNYQKLLGEFWECSPSTFKKLLTSCPNSAVFWLLDLFKLKDKDNIILVLKSATPKEKEDILIEMKDFIEEYISESEKALWKKLYRFLDNIIHNDNEKISVENGNCRPAKRMKSKS